MGGGRERRKTVVGSWRRALASRRRAPPCTDTACTEREPPRRPLCPHRVSRHRDLRSRRVGVSGIVSASAASDRDGAGGAGFRIPVGPHLEAFFSTCPGDPSPIDPSRRDVGPLKLSLLSRSRLASTNWLSGNSSSHFIVNMKLNKSFNRILILLIINTHHFLHHQLL